MTEKTTEKQFNSDVSEVLKAWLVDFKKQHNNNKTAQKLKIFSERQILTGSLPWWHKSEENGWRWEWKDIKREVDIVFGMKQNVYYENDRFEEIIIPLIAIELKTGNFLNTDELDKKGAIYSAINEFFPLAHTMYIQKSNEQRRMKDKSFLKNARNFNSIFPYWDDASQEIIKKIIFTSLEYQIIYWEM